MRHLQRLHVHQNAVLRRHARARHDGRPGVASPRAQGQAITSTATAWISAASVPALPTASRSSVINASPTTARNTAEPLHQPLQRRLGGLPAPPDQADDLGQHGSRPHRLHLHRNTMRPSPSDEPPVSRPPSSARHRQRLAG